MLIDQQHEDLLLLIIYLVLFEPHNIKVYINHKLYLNII